MIDLSQMEALLYKAPLHEEELLLIRGAKSDKRKQLFMQGRLAAHQALEKLGVQNHGPILRAERKRPLFQRGIVGSITHSDTTAAAIVGKETDWRGLGIDIENIFTSLEPAIIAKICGPSERMFFESLLKAEQAKAATIFFSAKEAIYKCVFPVIETFFGFHDATLYPNEDTSEIEVVLSPKIAAMLGDTIQLKVFAQTEDKRVCTVATLSCL